MSEKVSLCRLVDDFTQCCVSQTCLEVKEDEQFIALRLHALNGELLLAFDLIVCNRRS